MKHLLYTVAALAAFTLPAQAEDYFNPYIGADYQFTRLSYDGGGNDNFNGFNIHVGNRFTDYVGLELGYFRTGEESYTDNSLGTPVNVKGRLTGATLDALGYLPVTEDKSFELIGTAGVSYIRGEIEATALGVTVEDDESEWGFRAGGGAQYNVTDNMNIRGIARYQTADFDDIADRAWVFSLGANYQF